MGRIIPVLMLLMTACRSRPVQPAGIEPADMCAFCRMSISDRRFAAQLIFAGREPLKFDDIGCMLRRLDEHPAAFVMDYDSRRWLPAESALFVRSPEIRSPMAGGLLAVGERARADAHAARFGGAVLSFQQLRSGTGRGS